MKEGALSPIFQSIDSSAKCDHKLKKTKCLSDLCKGTKWSHILSNTIKCNKFCTKKKKKEEGESRISCDRRAVKSKYHYSKLQLN